MLPKTVAEVMSREVITLREEDNLADVARGFEQYRMHHLPVVDEGKLVGLLSQRDMLRFTVSTLERAGVADARDAWTKENTFVAMVMTRDPETVHPETPIPVAAQRIRDGRFGCLPVVDADGTLVGIVTAHDLISLIAAGP